MNKANDNDKNLDIEWTDEQTLARDTVRSLGEPELSEGFAQSLRASFVSGDFGARGLQEDSSDPPRDRSRSQTESPARLRPRATSSRVRRQMRWAVPMAVAAALALVVGLGNQGSPWVVNSATGVETVWVDGQEISCDDLSPIQAVLHPGCHIVIPEGGQMEVASAGNFMLQLNGGVEVTLPSAPGRWFGRGVSSELGGDGTLRVITGSDFEGATYRLRTSNAELLVTGTAFSVVNTSEFVRVCVLDGDVEARMDDGSFETIGAGSRITFVLESGAVERGEMHATERAALIELRDRAHS